jgi:hypothetical protein
MHIDELNEILGGIREALLNYQDGHCCRRCKKKMPSTVTAICLGAGVFNEAEPRKTWAVNWRAAEEGWGFVEIGTNRFWICPGCVSELLPLEDPGTPER